MARTDLALQNVALDWNVLVWVCAATVVQHTFNCKVSTFSGEFPLGHNFQTEKEDIARGTPDV